MAPLRVHYPVMMNPFNVLRDACYFSIRNLLPLALICLPFIALESSLQRVLGEALDHQVPPLYPMLIALVIYPIYSTSLILFMDARTRGEMPRVGALWLSSALLWPRMSVLAGISTLLIMLGMSLFVLPALWVMTRLAFAEYLLILEGRTPLQAMRDSYELTRGHFWTILLCLIVVLVPVWTLEFWLTDAPDEPRMDAAAEILSGSLIGFVQMFSSVVLYRLYMLRQAEGHA
ncbi:glycerophosphoryl diester phosphodiesterase membrane domain-containing protein [Pseudomonas matsuisoli]|uniref:glycerophosphoryl diester phosphodiesterase membrane domain-containing protein n=1 Tax=Pseudomonas matsuisoli TaxID=1515666 RepID=UPI001E4DACAA|nr:glycerophosphoryl diester phosphodiesterase membrane domain-containing protein [Pseudomonas matsuisoli]